MFSGGDYDEVARWLGNFAARTPSARTRGSRSCSRPRARGKGRVYGVRLRLGERLLPPPGQPPLELAFREVADNRGSLAWCSALAARIRSLARELSEAERSSLKSA